MTQMTISQFAEKNSMDYPTASALTKLLVSLGQANKTDLVVKTAKRGKGSVVYEYPESVTLQFAA